MTSLTSGFTDAPTTSLTVTAENGAAKGPIPQRCIICLTPDSARGYYKIGFALNGICRTHYNNKFSHVGNQRVWWFTEPVDQFGRLLHAGDLVRIYSGEKPSRKVFMVNQVCRARPSCCLLSNGAYVLCKELIIEGGS